MFGPLGMGEMKPPQKKHAGFSPCFHVPGFHFGCLFLTQTHLLLGKTWQAEQLEAGVTG